MKLLLSLLFPPRCVLCGSILKNGAVDLCADCRKTAPEYQNRKIYIPFIDSFTAVWYYDGNVRRSILRYKFYRARSHGTSYGRLLAMKVSQTHPEGFDLLTWVPVSPLRRLTRGYDQCRILAVSAGRELGISPTPLLKKIRHNPPQSGLRDKSLRSSNVMGVYRISRGADLTGKRILLLDDVLTTGSTAGECARILKMHGAKEVHCAAVAAARK